MNNKTGNNRSDKTRIHPWSITGQVPDKRQNFATRPGNGDVT